MIITIAGWVLVVSIVLLIVDFFRSQDSAERAFKVDLIALNCVGLFACLAAQRQSELYLEVALVWALFAFIGTAVFARYLAERERG